MLSLSKILLPQATLLLLGAWVDASTCTQSQIHGSFFTRGRADKDSFARGLAWLSELVVDFAEKRHLNVECIFNTYSTARD